MCSLFHLYIDVVVWITFYYLPRDMHCSAFLCVLNPWTMKLLQFCFEIRFVFYIWSKFCLNVRQSWFYNTIIIVASRFSDMWYIIVFLRIAEAINSYYFTIYVTSLAPGYKNRPKDLMAFVILENTTNTILLKIKERPNKIGCHFFRISAFCGGGHKRKR